jgi:hypothetical protein
MDEGLPIAYLVLDKGVAVLASDDVQVGTVHHVVAAPEKDIFHGIVINTADGQRFVAAADVQSLHEFGVDLRIDSAAAATLPSPHGAAPMFTENPATQQTWRHWVHRLTLRGDWTKKE